MRENVPRWVAPIAVIAAIATVILLLFVAKSYIVPEGEGQDTIEDETVNADLNQSDEEEDDTASPNIQPDEQNPNASSSRNNATNGSNGVNIGLNLTG